MIDLKASGEDGADWLRNAANLLPKDRVVLDTIDQGALRHQTDVIGYASWGSNDQESSPAFSRLSLAPGAIVTEYVSTDGRTFKKPPDNWTIRRLEQRPPDWFAGSPQTLTADYLLEGATGGHPATSTSRISNRRRIPNYLLPAYYNGRNLAESYYLAIRSLSWQNIVIGDPLCSLGKP